MTIDLASRPIGVFDSGVGGLTVLRALRRALPFENFLYLGDTARLPYGTKSGTTVTRYALQTTKFLVDQGVKLLVVACNTASSMALPYLEIAYPNLPVIGVIEPGAHASCDNAPHGRIAVIATAGTIREAAYQKAILKLRPEATIASRPCPILVCLAEEGWLEGPIVEASVTKYLESLIAEFPTGGPDCLVLGCTHFPLLTTAIRKVLPKNVQLIDSAETTAKCVTQELKTRGLFNSCSSPGLEIFFTTDNPERFARVGEIFLGRALAIEDVVLVDL